MSKSKPMTTATKRKKLHGFVDIADDSQLKAIYEKFEDYFTGKSNLTDSLNKIKKMDAMKQASNDPLFLSDLKEIKDDFDAVDYE
jgi:hypothetical protein